MAEVDNDAFEFDVGEVYARVERHQGVVLDVREQEEVAQFAIPGSLHIPLGELMGRTAEVPRDTDVFIICHVGQRSAMATEYLRGLGYERVWNIRGGIIAWIRSRQPLSRG
jgi:rhodanese-related sulfurtransferase